MLKRKHVLPLLILALAFALRMGQPALTEFKLDEAGVVRRAQAIAYEGERPAVGAAASVGPTHPPLMLYLMAFAVRLWNDPLAAVLFTTLLNSLAVWACYALARAGFDARTALIATALFAVSPWAVLYARKIWSQNLPLMTLGFFAALHATVVRRRPWALVGAFAALAGLLGLHLGGLIFIPILGLCLVVYRREVAPRALAAGIAVLLLLTAPYLLHDARQGWRNVRGVFGYAGEAPGLSLDALRYAFTLAGSAGIEGQAGPFHAQFRRSLPGLGLCNAALSALLAAALIHAAVQALRGATEARRRGFSLLLLWFWVPVLSQLRGDTQPHYVILLYPVQFLLVGALLADLMTRWRPRRKDLLALVRVALGAALVLWAGWQVAVTLRLRAVMVQHPTTGGHGIPLRYPRRAARAARQWAGEAEVIVVSDDTRPFITETPTVFDALLFGHPHRFTDGWAALPVPDAARAVYLTGPLTPGEVPPTLARLRDGGALTEGPGVTLADGVRYRTFAHARADREAVTAGMAPLAAGIPFANKVVVAATDAPARAQAGGTTEVWLAWWLQGPPPSHIAYHFTVQVQAPDGSLLAQDDHAGFPARYWRPGDLVVSRFVVTLPTAAPTGTYRLRAGLYSYPDVTVVPVVDPQGAPIDDGVTLGELTLRD
jgi:hypothetical protein